MRIEANKIIGIILIILINIGLVLMCVGYSNAMNLATEPIQEESGIEYIVKNHSGDVLYELNNVSRYQSRLGFKSFTYTDDDGIERKLELSGTYAIETRQSDEAEHSVDVDAREG